MLEFNTAKNTPAAEREELFSLDGTVYTIPVSFSAGQTLTYVDGLRKYGPDMAGAWALETALGTEGYQALLGADEATIPREAFVKLLTVVTRRILGQDAEVPGPKAPTRPTPVIPKQRGSKGSTSK